MRVTTLLLLAISCAPWALADTPKLVFVSDQDYPPVTFLDRGHARGMWVDMARAVALRLGMPFSIEVEDWAKAQQDVQEGRADVLFAVSFSAERAGVYEFSQPVSRNLFTFFRKGQELLGGLSDLAGFRVGVVSGGLPAQVIGDMTEVAMTKFATYEEAFTALEEGKIDVFAADRWVGSYILSSGDWQGIVAAHGNFASLDNGFALRKGNIALRDKLNTVIAELKKDGTFGSIADQWTGKSVVYVTHETVFNAISAVLILVLLLLGFWVLVLMRAIAQKNRMEKQLLEQTNLLRTVINTMPDLVWLKDLNGVFRVCNHKVELLFGLPESQIIGKTDYELWGSEKADQVLQENREIMHGGRTVRIEEEFFFKGDGHRELVESAKTPVCGVDGEVVGLLGIARDITQRKQAETTLIRQTAQFRTLLNALPDLVWIKDLNGVFLSCNRRFAELYGLSEEEIIGKTDYDLLDKEHAELYLQGDRKVIADQQPVIIEEEALFPDGIRRLMESTKEAVHDDSGRRLGVLGISRDITQRRETERERMRLLSELQQSKKMESLGTLAGGIAHDMNNVLAAILAQATVGTTLNPPDSRNFRAFSSIAKASSRGGKMVKNILSFARKSPATTEAVDLNLIIREEVSLLEHTMPSGIQIDLQLDAELAKIRGDADALGGAIMNLCVNAVHAMSDSGTLSLRTRNLASMVEILVTDTGSGMPKEVLEKAIEPFFTTKPMGQGTGLGLATVYSLVKAHGGTMEITSEVGKGTTVTLLFPVSENGSAGALDAVTETDVLVDGTELHVLVVDDDELVEVALGESIEALGHRVTLTESGERALPLLESGLKPDVVVLDLNMPGWGGSETLHRIRKLRPDLPVILSTGRLDQTAVDLKESVTGVTLLAKPYTLEELGKQLRRAVAKKPRKSS